MAESQIDIVEGKIFKQLASTLGTLLENLAWQSGDSTTIRGRKLNKKTQDEAKAVIQELKALANLEFRRGQIERRQGK